MPSTTYAMDATWRPILKDLGLSESDVLRRAALSEGLLKQVGLRLQPADFYRFWNAMGEALQAPDFPLQLCRVIRSESFSPPLFAAMCSPNYLVAVKRIADYKPLVGPLRLEVRERADEVTLELIWLPQAMTPPASLVVAELLFFVLLIRMGTRELVQPLRVTCTEPPESQRAYHEFLGVPLERGREQQLVFRTTDALRPFLTSNEGLWAAFEPELRVRLAELNTSAAASWAQRVRAVLLEALPSGMVAMDTVARRLALSKRTLQRQLEAEGTSYMQLLRETRESLARHYLHRTQLPMAEISFLLGFEEPNSFYRAFRDWTGLTPERVRQQERPLDIMSKPA